MHVINALQSLGILVLYTILVLAVPAAVLGRRISGRRLCEKFLICIIAGNFYIINIVFILQFLHISNGFTLFLSTFGAAAAFLIVRDRVRLKSKLAGIWDIFGRFLRKTMGRRTFLELCRKNLGIKFKSLMSRLGVFLLQYGWELIFAFILSCVICVAYGSNSVINNGYTVSDIPVHNYWINAMSDNDLFVAGVYPYGFHCIIYYMHAVFGIDTYVLLRLFTVTSALYIHLALFAFCRGVCRSVYPAYAAVFLFAAVNMLNRDCVIRYVNNLPQEYGMIFILPSIYFIFEFFRHQKRCPEKLKLSVLRKYPDAVMAAEDLVYAAVSFSLTIAVHFYGTMIAGLFCVGVVAGFCGRFFRPRYLAKILAAFVLGVFLGVLPMAAAVLMGKPMQGSIGWGLSVITGSESTTGNNTIVNERESGQDEQSSQGQQDEQQSGIDGNGANQQGSSQETDKTSVSEVIKRLQGISIKTYNSLVSEIEEWVFPSDSVFYVWFMLISCAVLIIFGVISGICSDYDYGARLITAAVSIILIHVLFIADTFGLPMLMDQNRTRIYMTYSMTALVAMDMDLIPYFVSPLINEKRFYNVVSLIVCTVVCVRAVDVYGIREPIVYTASEMLETDGAVYCLGKIIKENEDKTWTILSANDELRMIDNHGYHYETLELLKEMKSYPESRITIPTKYIYVYVEKIPVDYTVEYEGSGQRISREGAAETLPQFSRIVSYTGRYRWIIMSKMYYWAEEFRKLFPEDMSIYYEDEEFICYKLVQNTSNLYNLNIDFGYRN